MEGDRADLRGLRAQNVRNRVGDNGGEAGPITFDLLIQPLGIAKEIHLRIFKIMHKNIYYRIIQ